MVKLWNVVIDGTWVGTVTASTYDIAIMQAIFEFGKDARCIPVENDA